MKRKNRLLLKALPWVFGVAALFVLPVCVAEFVIDRYGTDRGLVYFGTDPQYVFPVPIRNNSGYVVREVGGGIVCDLPLGGLAMTGFVIVIGFGVFAVGVNYSELQAPADIRRSKEGRWLERLKKGFCPECGYDVRATPDLCPECGCPLAEKAAAHHEAIKRMWAKAGLEPPDEPSGPDLLFGRRLL